jgi:hypothetical protein
MHGHLNDRVLSHYLEFGLFTYPALYRENLAGTLPDNVRQIGQLVKAQIIHQVSLKNYEVASTEELEQGTTTKIPWFRQPEDANLTTAAAMLAELYRRDERGFVRDRAVKDKLILTCRPVSILMASILKSKGIPARVRSGFASYLPGYKAARVDHWISQYWDRQQKRWISVDVDGSEVIETFDPYDVPSNVFDFSADAWIDSRHGRVDPKEFWNAKGEAGLIFIAWELFYDFHCLMNSEIIYPHHPEMSLPEVFPNLTEDELTQIDELAKLMLKPDDNFEKLERIWQSSIRFRRLKGTLLYNS